MREIKFRGKSLDTDLWVYGYGVAVYEDNAVIIHKQGKNTMQHTAVDPETVGQFTGLKDKNGKEIYEGDVLKCFDLEYLDMPDFKGVVAIDDCEFFLKDKNNESIELWSDGTNDYFTMSLLQTNECCEIIGNIYENPKLLNP